MQVLISIGARYHLPSLVPNREIVVGENATAASQCSIFNFQCSMNQRPELRMLQDTIDISKQSTRLLRAGNLPQVLLTGGYAVSNPNTFNGFEKKLDGFWHVGIVVRVPIWNWGDVRYKVRASKRATAIASLELEETREKIELQVNQNTFRVDEAYKRLAMARSDIRHADENLRTAKLGLKEGASRLPPSWRRRLPGYRRSRSRLTPK